MTQLNTIHRIHYDAAWYDTITSKEINQNTDKFDLEKGQ